MTHETPMTLHKISRTVAINQIKPPQKPQAAGKSIQENKTLATPNHSQKITHHIELSTHQSLTATITTTVVVNPSSNTYLYRPTIECFPLRTQAVQPPLNTPERVLGENFPETLEESGNSEKETTTAPVLRDHLAQYFHAVETTRLAKFLQALETERMARDNKAIKVAQAYANYD